MGDTTIAAADHISFSVAKGELCVVVGPSGAGKTTLLNMLGGMDNCDEGEIYLDGAEISSYGKRELTDYRRYDVGFVFQFYNLVQNLTALENVELAAQICKEPLDAAGNARFRRAVGQEEQLSRSAFRRRAAARFHSACACKESEARSLRRADGSPRLQHRKNDTEASPGHLPQHRKNDNHNNPQLRAMQDGGPCASR